MPALTFRNFQGGEIDPSFYSDIQNPQRQTGLKTARNFFINKSGSASNRAGFGYLADAPVHADATRVIEFILNSNIAYVLVLGDLTMEVYQGSTLKDTVVTPWSKDYIFDLQYIQSDNIIIVASVTGTDNQHPLYEIERVSDTDWTVTQKTTVPESPPPTSLAMSSVAAGSNEYVYAVTAVDINGNESYGGVLNGGVCVGISVPQSDYGVDYSVRVKTASGHGLSVGDRFLLVGGIVHTNFNYHIFEVSAVPSSTELEINAIDGDDIPVPITVSRITGFTQANPVVVTVAAGHSFANAQSVYMYGCDMVELNENVYTVANATATTFELQGVDGTGYTAGSEGFTANSEFTSGVLFYKQNVVASSAAAPTEGDPHIITYVGAGVGVGLVGSHAVEYNIYRQDAGSTFGYIGSSTTTTYSDIGTVPDVSIRPPVDRLELFKSSDWPSVVGRYQERLIIGNTEANIEIIRLSKTGDDGQFTGDTPLTAGSAFDFALAGRETNAIKHIIDVNGLVIMTEGGEWVVAGDQSGSVIPTSPNPRQGSYNGASKVRPLVIGENAIYVQNGNSAIRDLRYDFERNGYAGIDLIEFAAHLFKGTTVKDWAYQQNPDSNVWVCMEDGTAAVLTYIPERGIVAWCTVDTMGGTIESLTSIPENGEDRIYAIIKRTIDGSTVRYLERMADRNVTDLEIDSIFLDSFITYDGRNTGSTTLTTTAITDYLALTSVTINTSANYFVAGDVNKKLHFRTSSTVFDNDIGENVTTIVETILVIDTYTSATEVIGHAEADIPVAHQATATTDWGKALNVITGLSTLEGEVVSCTADGDFVSGYDSDGNAISAMTVTSGQITLTSGQFGEIVHTGLRYNSDLVTLEIDIPTGESLLNRQKRINRVHLLVKESKDIHVGQDTSSLKKIQNTITDGKELDAGQIEVTIPTRYEKAGSVTIRMQEAKPITVTGIIISGSIEGVE